MGVPAEPRNVRPRCLQIVPTESPSTEAGRPPGDRLGIRGHRRCGGSEIDHSCAHHWLTPRLRFLPAASLPARPQAHAKPQP
eukprot:1179544-Prorocentrum_minimum.AAC.3